MLAQTTEIDLQLEPEAMPGKVTSIQLGRAQTYSSSDSKRPAWTSGIVKSAVEGSVPVGLTGIDGDEQADLVHHGGPDKAILGYALTHYATWTQEYSEAGFAPGGFGENLTIEGLDESTCCIGDTFRVGTCLMQITQPRQPCWKLSRRWNLPMLAAEVQRNGRTGWYYRVVQPGTIQSGQTLELVERPHPALTIAWASRVMHAKPVDPINDQRLLDCPELSESWKETLRKRLQGNIRSDEPRLSGPDH